MDVMHNLARFVASLQDAEYSTAASPFNLSVKYRGDDSVYFGWPLPRGQYITSTGLQDPGFGSGPIEFSDIEWVSVHAVPRHHPNSESYRAKFLCFSDAVRSIDGVSISAEVVTYHGV